MTERVRLRCADGSLHTLEANSLAQRLFGDTVTAHTLMLGYAWQLGLVPLTFGAIDRYMAQQGTAVALNRRAFAWGRIAAANPALIAGLDAGLEDMAPTRAGAGPTLDELVDARSADLRAYQDDAYAMRYRALVQRARDAERAAGAHGDGFARAVAENAYRLMAYKDEYEVARLYGSREFLDSLRAQFADTGRISLWLAPPLLARRDPLTGRPRKRRFGPWILPAFRVLARLKGLRGTVFDPFGHTAERRAERRLVRDYEALVGQLYAVLGPHNLAQARALAGLAGDVRGFGPVKEAAIADYERRRAELLAALPAPALARAG